MPLRPHSAGAAIRLLVVLGLVVGALALPAIGAPGDPGRAASSGFGALMDGGTQAAASASSDGHPTRSATASGLQGAAGAVGQVEVELGAGTSGSDALATAQATARDILLLGGRVAVANLSVSVQAHATGAGPTAGLSGYSATGLVVDGQPMDAVPGRQIDIAGAGTLVFFEQVTDSAGAAQANGLRLEITDPASGLPVGTTIVIGHVQASAGRSSRLPRRLGFDQERKEYLARAARCGRSSPRSRSCR